MILHNRPNLGSEEKEVALKVLSSQCVSQGEEVLKFENDLCNFFGLPEGHAVVVSSGSSALFLALWALKGKGKRVGFPVYSCAALRNAAGMLGSKKVFLDCAKENPNIDYKEAEKKGIDILIAPSMYGIPVELPTKCDYQIIEDLAQSMGAKANDERIGLRGEIGICSFYATKMMTSGGQGGAVISRHKKYIDNIRDYREFDCREDSQLRFNFQMTDLQAAIGRVQLKKLPYFIEQREKWFNIYKEYKLNLIVPKNKNFCPVRYRIVHKCRNPNEIIKSLNNNNIKAIIPIEEKELLDKSKEYLFALELTRSTVSLPAHLALNENQVRKIAEIVSNISQN
ncbi:DegT/DnrJ/EryC1/StrS aminotransferase family protein [Candidatus Pelagibacter sp.]|nr:DegT/DnrJ/EryC1/StrS aminotransferase family protein [Candidatus Pelagibacter sp.]